MHNLSEFDSKGLAAALAACREGMDAGQAPFGAAIGLNETLVAIAHNTGSRDHDPTAHAEVNAIRRACSTIGTTKLDGATLFSSCEPCPMCFSAAVFAGIRRFVWSASVDDAKAAGMTRLQVSNAVMIEATGEQVEVIDRVRHDEGVVLLTTWRARQAT